MADYELDPLVEQQLEHRLREFGNEAVRPFDAVEITRVAAATAGSARRSRLAALPTLSGGWRPVLILALLAVSLIGVGIIGGFIKLPDNNLVPNPSFEPFSPPPTILPSPSGPTASPDGSTVPSVVPGSPQPSAGPGTSSPPPTATPSPEPSVEPTTFATPSPEPSPTAIPTVAPVTAVTAVAAADSHSCALASDGRVFCWGFNDMGQLGDGTNDYRDFPTIPVVGIDDAVAISAGIRFSCAVRDDGSVWCWGEDLTSDGANLLPVRVVGITDATAVTAGGTFACALRQGGEVACWGNNSLGQLGSGLFDDGGPTPQAVTGIDDAVQLSAGWNHACVVREDRTTWCWGGNGDGATGYGQLGDGTFENRAAPVQVGGMGDTLEVDGGGWTTCATRTDGSVWCWGYGEYGTLGDGDSMSSATPVQVSGIDDALTVSVGRFKACAVRGDGSTWCWGDTSWGSSTGGPARTPVQGNGSSITEPVRLAADRQLIVLDGSGAVWNWGGGTNQAPSPWPIGP